MKFVLLALFLGLNIHAETGDSAGSGANSGNTNNWATSVNNGGGCSQTRSWTDLGILSALLAILAIPSFKKRMAANKARKS